MMRQRMAGRAVRGLCALAVPAALLLSGTVLSGTATAQPAAKLAGETLADPARVETAGGTRFDFEAPKPGTYELPVIKPAPDGSILDTRGRPRQLHDLMGDRLVLLSFVYLSCTDVCPVATGMLNTLRIASARAPALRDNLAFVTLSFDPARDTPAVVAEYAAAVTGDIDGAPWHFLTTASQRDIDPILAAYGQPVRRPRHGADIAHLLRVYLIDRDKRIRNIYGLGFLDPRLLRADVQTLLHEEAGSGA